MPATILIVEDHDVVRKSLREWLGAVFPSFDLVEAATGEEAVTLARERPLRAVVMDIGLPQMSGIEATRRIKQAAPATEVVILTIHEGAAYRADATAAGASAYVPKRKMRALLVPTLTALLRTQEESCAAA
ncbi:MAG: response regulator transcription factor [Anaerolineales bacterium]|nr:MAG: response regulator transcription factor [Anaerolineales bacterium]